VPIKTWLGKAYVVLSEKQAVRSLRQVPLFGMVIHGISHLCLPWSTRTWVEVEAGVGNGLRMLLNPRYDRGYWHGDYEPNIQEVFMKHIKPGAVVYDIGANIGFFAMVAARLSVPSAKYSLLKQTRTMLRDCGRTATQTAWTGSAW